MFIYLARSYGEVMLLEYFDGKMRSNGVKILPIYESCGLLQVPLAVLKLLLIFEQSTSVRKHPVESISAPEFRSVFV